MSMELEDYISDFESLMGSAALNLSDEDFTKFVEHIHESGWC